MADGVVAAVVPSHAAEHSPAAASRTSTRVPLAELAPPGRQPGAPCAVAAVDARGRVSDRTVVQFLGWAPGLRIDIRAVSGSVLARASTDGVFTLTAQGYVRLPAAVRHWCALMPTDKVLLVPEPDRHALMIHTMSAVETLVREHHTGLWAGER